MNGTNRSYRARLQRPCDACRRRKSCCVRDLNAAQCSLCKMRGALCTFDSAPRARRRKENPTLAVPLPEPPAQLQQAPLAGTPQAQVHMEAETPLSAVSEDSNGKRQSEWIAQFVGLSGDQDPYVLRHCTFRENRYHHPDFACLRILGHQCEEPAHFTVVPDGHLDSRPEWYPTMPTLDLDGETHANLLDAFLTNIHSAYPLLAPATLTTDLQKMDPPLLGVIYLLASRYSRRSLPDEQLQAWQKFVFQALPIETRYPRLETAEAELLWLQRHTRVHRAPTMPGLWSEVGSLVGMSHVLGLNVDPTGWAISRGQINRRIRIANGVFILDKWLALGLGRPSYISRDNWDVPLPTENHFPDRSFRVPDVMGSGSGDDFRFATDVFIAMAKLSLILADVLETFYTIRALEQMKHMAEVDLYQLLAGFEFRLEAFNTEHMLPSYHHCRYSSSDTNDIPSEEPPVCLDPRGTVVLAFYTLKTVLYRAVLRHLPPPHATPTMTTIRDRARDVLLSTTRFLAGLTVSETRAFWWSPISRINFAIVGSFMFSMLLTSTEEAQVDFWVREIGRYRRLLDLHGGGIGDDKTDAGGGVFDITRLAAKRLELLSCVATGFGDTEEMGNPWDLRI